jgi:thiamine kinase-like enzyme
VEPVLPRAIQLKLEQTLAQWPQWQCSAPASAPRVVRVLTPGVSNHSVLVDAGALYVVRIDGLNPSAHGLCRQSEWRTLAAAYEAGLAPGPRYFNPDLGSLVCDYLEPDPARQTDNAEVGRLLRAIHQLPSRHHRLDLAERILRYEKQLEHRQRRSGAALQGCHDAVIDLLREVAASPSQTVLCHNDLLRANRIYSGGTLYALDWEYCAMGNPWYDIAVVTNGDSLTERETELLLTAYLGRMPDTQERHSLYQFSCIYRYLELIWYLALEKPVLGPELIEEKCVALGTLLARTSA